MAKELTFSLKDVLGEKLPEVREKLLLEQQRKDATTVTAVAIHQRIGIVLKDPITKGLKYPEEFDDFLADISGMEDCENTLGAMTPEKLTWAADILMQNDQPEAAEAILITEEQQPRFPDNFQSTRMLAEIASKRDDGKRIVELLADGDGNPRFPEHMEALGVLLFGLDICNRFDDVIRIVQNLRDTDPNAWLEHEDIVLNYMSALNLSNRCAETIAEFLDDENHLKIPVEPTPLIMARIAIALDNQRQFQRVLNICQPLYNSDERFRNDADFVVAMAHALIWLNRPSEARDLLSENEGENPRFPNHEICMRLLEVACIKADEAKEATKTTIRGVVRSVRAREEL